MNKTFCRRPVLADEIDSASGLHNPHISSTNEDSKYLLKRQLVNEKGA